MCPLLQDVIDLAVQRQYMSSWHIYIAGLSERFRRTSSLEGVPDELLRAMLAFDLTNPVAESDEGTITWMQHPWKQVLLHERPELVRQAYEAVARAKLARGEQHPDGMRELLTHEALARSAKTLSLGLLRDFPNANAFPLHELLMAALGMPSAHTTLLALADRVLSGAVTGRSAAARSLASDRLAAVVGPSRRGLAGHRAEPPRNCFRFAGLHRLQPRRGRAGAHTFAGADRVSHSPRGLALSSHGISERRLGRRPQRLGCNRLRSRPDQRPVCEGHTGGYRRAVAAGV